MYIENKSIKTTLITIFKAINYCNFMLTECFKLNRLGYVFTMQIAYILNKLAVEIITFCKYYIIDVLSINLGF